jgi:COX assembly mitochondrial protein 2
MPALIESEHPACAALIKEYLHCSGTASLLSKIIFSECTALKYKLDACFRQEKLERTKRNIKRGKVPFLVCSVRFAHGVASVA